MPFSHEGMAYSILSAWNAANPSHVAESRCICSTWLHQTQPWWTQRSAETYTHISYILIEASTTKCMESSWMALAQQKQNLQKNVACVEYEPHLLDVAISQPEEVGKRLWLHPMVEAPTCSKENCPNSMSMLRRVETRWKLAMCQVLEAEQCGNLFSKQF